MSDIFGNMSCDLTKIKVFGYYSHFKEKGGEFASLRTLPQLWNMGMVESCCVSIFAARNFIMSNNMEILKQHLKTFVKAALTGGMGPNFSKLGITGECM